MLAHFTAIAAANSTASSRQKRSERDLFSFLLDLRSTTLRRFFECALLRKAQVIFKLYEYSYVQECLLLNERKKLLKAELPAFGETIKVIHENDESYRSLFKGGGGGGGGGYQFHRPSIFEDTFFKCNSTHVIQLDDFNRINNDRTFSPAAFSSPRDCVVVLTTSEYRIIQHILSKVQHKIFYVSQVPLLH